MSMQFLAFKTCKQGEDCKASQSLFLQQQILTQNSWKAGNKHIVIGSPQKGLSFINHYLRFKILKLSCVSHQNSAGLSGVVCGRKRLISMNMSMDQKKTLMKIHIKRHVLYVAMN